MPVTTVSGKGQVVIPKAVRDALALRPGTKLLVSVDDGRILLKPVPDRPEEGLYGKYKHAALLSELQEARARLSFSDRADAVVGDAELVMIAVGAPCRPDGRSIYDPGAAWEAGLVYLGIGR